MALASGDAPRMNLADALAVRDEIAHRMSFSTDSIEIERAKRITERLIGAGYIDIDFVLARVQEDDLDEVEG